MAVTQRNYSSELVAAAKSVLLELMRALGEYREEIVVVGGWVPELILPSTPLKHVGSIDVDLALDHRKLEEAGYATIQKLLLGREYEQGSQPFIFFRTVEVGGKPIRVQVDFLAGEYEGAGPGHRTQKVKDVRARKARGCDLAFELFVEKRIEGRLPDGGEDSTAVRVASVVSFLVMKGMALHDRMKEKDAWDIYFCLRNFPGGLDGLVGEFRPYIGNALVREGLMKIHEKFASPSHVGPKFVADFEGSLDSEARERLIRDAYERVDYLLRALGLFDEPGSRSGQ